MNGVSPALFLLQLRFGIGNLIRATCVSKLHRGMNRQQVGSKAHLRSPRLDQREEDPEEGTEILDDGDEDDGVRTRFIYYIQSSPLVVYFLIVVHNLP